MLSNKTLILSVVASAVVFGFLAAASPAFAASSEKVLYSFCSSGGTCADGAYPNYGVIIDSAGNLYGTNLAGSGQYCVSYGVQCGTVFELIPSNGKWTEKVLYSFCSANNCADGDGPTGLIFDKAGNLYGSTASGGANNSGIVFELIHNSNDTWTEKVLYNFAYSFGSTAGLVFDKNGNLYGVSNIGGGGGCQFGCGTVFELIHGNGKWTEKVLHSFNGKDGDRPSASLIFDNAGNLYGTTNAGGADSSGCSGLGCGTVFELSPGKAGKWTEKVLHSFYDNGKEGIYPEASLIFDKAGKLYGTTDWGGAYGNFGTVFELIPNGGKWTEKVLHSFDVNGSDGFEPFASGVVQNKAGNLYGTTDLGGNAPCTQGCGTVFEVTP